MDAGEVQKSVSIEKGVGVVWSELSVRRRDVCAADTRGNRERKRRGGEGERRATRTGHRWSLMELAHY